MNQAKKIIFVGEAQSGKTSVINRFLVNKFTENYHHTAHLDFKMKILKTK